MTDVCSKIIFNTAWSDTDPVLPRLWDAKSCHSCKSHYRDFRDQASQGPGPQLTPALHSRVLGLGREAFERRNSHAWGSMAEQKDSLFPASFLQVTARRKVFDTDKQLTNSGHLSTVNQLQKALRMRDSWGGKSLLGKRHSCSDWKVTLCRLGRSGPITGHIKGFEMISAYSWVCCKSHCRHLRGEPCSANGISPNQPRKVSDSWSDLRVMTALEHKGSSTCCIYRVWLTASTPKAEEWLYSLAVKTTEKNQTTATNNKIQNPPNHTKLNKKQMCKEWGAHERYQRWHQEWGKKLQVASSTRITLHCWHHGCN